MVSTRHEYQNLPKQSLYPAPAVRAGGRPACGHRAAGRGHPRRLVVPDTARRDRLGQDLHDGQRHRAARPAGDGDGAEQDAGGAAVFRAARFLSRERGRVFRLLLRLLPARGLCAVARRLYREGFQHQRADRADAIVRHQGAAGARRLRDRRDRLGDLRHRRPGRLPRHDPAPAP